MKHAKNKSFLIIFFFILLCFGCKKVIRVDIKNTSSQIVITGMVTNEPGPYTVTLSRTANYTAENVFPPVSGATVVISSTGTTDTLSEISAGIYTTHTIIGIPGDTYNLYVSSAGQIYTATSTMPQPVPLDSLGYVTDRKGDRYNAVVFFQDPPGIANYYEFIEYNNGVEFKNNRGVSVFSDRLSDGKYITHNLYDDSTDINKGDTVTIQMNCVDVNVYNYFYQLNLITDQNGFQSPTPDNPASNISNHALGYFSANTAQRRSVFVP
ncbi:MAG: DUF4249 domain-containing protein [Bacteroidota bacterium]|nr:DUF4249 domain-containing protein [Bacteroidota bacterium]